MVTISYHLVNVDSKSFVQNFHPYELIIWLSNLSKDSIVCRWLIFCHMPMFCSSLPHYETTLVFGRTLLRAIFRSESKKLLERCQVDKEKFTEDQKILFLHLPKWEFSRLFLEIKVLIWYLVANMATCAVSTGEYYGNKFLILMHMMSMNEDMLFKDEKRTCS